MILKESWLRKSIRYCNPILISFMVKTQENPTSPAFFIYIYNIKREHFEKSRELVSEVCWT